MSRRRSWLGSLALEARRAIQLGLIALRLAVGIGGRRLLRLPERSPTPPERIRMAMENLGLTYVKLGQYLAMRFDILPAEVCRELGKLFDEVQPLPSARIAHAIEESLGAPLESLFARFDPEPIASASVAQVHEAWTHEGEHVAVKVQRPGIERIFATDIRLLRRLTRLADRLHLLGRLSATEMLDEFAGWTARELDFLQEGLTAELVGQDAEPYEAEPKVYWSLTSLQVLTLEFLDGVSLAQVVRIVETEGPERLAELYPDVDVDLVLHHMTFASLRQIFVRGLFHGDPHPGNVLVLDGNRIGFVDFGIFGRLSSYDREILGGQIEQLAVGNVDESLRIYAKQLSLTDESDARGFRREARAVLRQWYDVSANQGSSLEERHVGGYIGQMIDISRRYRLLYDMRYLLYWRALNALDSTALRLSQQFDLMDELRQFFEDVQPSVGARLVETARDVRTWSSLEALVAEAPQRLTATVSALAESRSVLSARAAETQALSGDRHREAATIAASAAAVSLFIVAADQVLPAPLRVLFAVAGFAVGLIAYVRPRRA